MSSNNPIVILDDVSLELPADVIAEITTGMGQQDGLGLETNQESTAAVAATAAVAPTAATDDDWFQAGPSTAPWATLGATPHLSSGRKDMKALLKSLRSPSPTPSRASSSSRSAAADEEDSGAGDDWYKFLEEEQQRRNAEEARRVEWSRRAAGRRVETERKLLKARGLVSSLTGEWKILKHQREALRAQLRSLDEQEASLDRRKHSALKAVGKYESIVAKYKEMNI